MTNARQFPEQFARAWPITLKGVEKAQSRVNEYLVATRTHRYPALDAAVGCDIRLFVKHENHQPTGAFKVRNAFSLVTTLRSSERKRGIVAASTGNHGQGVAYAASLLDMKAVLCVPGGTNPEKIRAIQGWGGEVHEEGRDYDESIAVMQRLAARHGYIVCHSTNNHRILEGAATLFLELFQQASLDAVVVAVGGGSQAVGALTVARALQPSVEVYGVQAAGAAAIHDSWHSGRVRRYAEADTFAEGIATRQPYTLTFATLVEGLTGFVTVTDAEIAHAIRLLLRNTHTLVEGAGAAGLAGVLRLREALSGRRVGIVLSGSCLEYRALSAILRDG